MNRLVCLLGLLSSLAVAAPAVAQTPPTAPTYVFTTVDSVQRGTYLFITGVQEGASAASEVGLRTSTTYEALGDSCERYALMMMEKPGRYRLDVWVRQNAVTAECRLARVNP